MSAPDAEPATVLSELLFLTFNAAIFQRGLYARAQFRRARKWDVPVIVASDSGVAAYLTNVVGQIRRLWLGNEDGGSSELTAVTLLILDDAGAAVERWHFDVAPHAAPTPAARADASTVRPELQRLLRQIGVTVTFLPILRGRHTFRIAICERARSQTRGLVECPDDWVEARFRPVRNAEEAEFGKVVLGEFAVRLTVAYSVGEGAL